MVAELFGGEWRRRSRLSARRARVRGASGVGPATLATSFPPAYYHQKDRQACKGNNVSQVVIPLAKPNVYVYPLLYATNRVYAKSYVARASARHGLAEREDPDEEQEEDLAVGNEGDAVAEEGTCCAVREAHFRQETSEAEASMHLDIAPAQGQPQRGRPAPGTHA